MQAFPEFKNLPATFWAKVKFTSENLGYTDRKTNTIKGYTTKEIINLFDSSNIPYDYDDVELISFYSSKRALLLDQKVQKNLMNAQAAEKEFERLFEYHQSNCFLCKIPMNKQSGRMKKENYFTAIINILTEKTLRELGKSYEFELGFDDDPRGLVYFLNENRNIIGASSRRFDGAYPKILNPSIIWEIKEYYYATTFGSRVADGVYETQLDGYEFKEIATRTNHPIKHVFFIDAYKTWWIDGKSYLCRIIDILNNGLVDEVIVGREVFSRWPEFLREFV